MYQCKTWAAAGFKDTELGVWMKPAAAQPDPSISNDTTKASGPHEETLKDITGSVSRIASMAGEAPAKQARGGGPNGI